MTAGGGGASEEVDSSVGERSQEGTRPGTLGPLRNWRKGPLAGGQCGCGRAGRPPFQSSDFILREVVRGVEVDGMT